MSANTLESNSKESTGKSASTYCRGTLGMQNACKYIRKQTKRGHRQKCKHLLQRYEGEREREREREKAKDRERERERETERERGRKRERERERERESKEEEEEDLTRRRRRRRRRGLGVVKEKNSS
jgi:hypothetical protein